MNEANEKKRLLLFPRNPVNLSFGDVSYEVIYHGTGVKVLLDKDNFVEVTLKNQQVAYKARILGGFSHSEEKNGDIDFHHHFMIDWQDDESIPGLMLIQNPDEIRRAYSKGQKIELGIEEISSYRIVYEDNVVAEFTQMGENAFEFSFSSGFQGSFWKDADGTHSIKFKGIRLDADEDGYNSESKFIISRSKYTDNLVLVLQDDATLFLTL